MVARALVLSPQHALVAGGGAEDFELRIQTLFEQGQRHLVVDFSGVPSLDSRGIRTLVRAHTTAQRLGGSFKIVHPRPSVRELLTLTHLDKILGVYDSLDEASRRSLPWQRIGIVVGAVALCAALVWWDLYRPALGGGPDTSTFGSGIPSESAVVRPMLHPIESLLRLVVAALIGMLITAVHKPYVTDKPTRRSMQQAQVLLAVAGAMIMIIIGNSLARAFGIAGAASIIRFRTPVEDPKDVTILFLLMGLGMAAGLGGYAVAGLGTGFLCAFLLVLDRMSEQRGRLMRVDVIAEGPEFPTVYVQSVFARHRVSFETREVSLGDKMRVRYHANIPAAVALEDLGVEMMGGGAGVKSVTWEPAKEKD